MTSRGGEKLETGVKSLYDEVMALTTAIEGAIIKGQKSFGALSDITESDMASDEEPDLIDVNGGSGLVGWVDDI
jgi:hypothetical protein